MFKILYTVTIFIGIVILLRAVCKDRISAGLQYGIWLLVAVKLLVFPMPDVAGDFSVLGFVPAGQGEASGGEVSEEQSLAGEKSGTTANEAQGEGVGSGSLWHNGQMTGESVVPGTDTGGKPEYIGADAGGVSGFAGWRQRVHLRWQAIVENVLKVPRWLIGVWCVGSLFCAVWMAVYHVRLYRHLRRKRVLLDDWQECGDAPEGMRENEKGIPAAERMAEQPPWAGEREKQFVLYSVEGLPTPCLFGKSVYIPAGLAVDHELLPYIVRHEACHYFHGDTLWGFLRMLCVCLYWYHPLVWLSAYLSRQDCELACDEAVVRHMVGQERKRYGELLLGLVAIKSSPAECLSLGTAMSGSAKQLKQRLERIAGEKKSGIVPGIFVAAAAILGIYACVTNGFVQTDRQWQRIRISVEEGSVPILGERYEIKYRLSKDAASYGLYIEQYEYGVLKTAEILECGTLRREESQRKIKKGEAFFSRELEADRETGAYIKSRVSYSVPDYAGEEDGASSLFRAFTIDLSEIRGIGNSFGVAGEEQLEYRFRMNEDIILMASYYGDEQGCSVPGRNIFEAEKYLEEYGEILEKDRCVILTHLIVSDKSEQELKSQIDDIVREKESDLTKAGPLCRPWDGVFAEKRVVDVRRDEDFFALPAEPEPGAGDRLYLLGESNHFRLYGAGDYQSVLWNEGDTYTEIDVPFVVDGITMMAPEIQEADYDGDGEPELALKMLWGEGTGLWVESLWMFDREAGEVKAYEYHTGDYEEALLQELSWEEVDGERRLLFEEMPVTPLLREEEGVSYREAGINTGRVSFAFGDGKIKLRTLLYCGSRAGEVTPAYGDAALEAEVLYAGNGEFFLGDVDSVDMEETRNLAEEAVRELYAPREITFAEYRYHLGTWRFSEQEGERMEMTLTVLAEGEDSYDFAEVPLVRGDAGYWETGEILIQK